MKRADSIPVKQGIRYYLKSCWFSKPRIKATTAYFLALFCCVIIFAEEKGHCHDLSMTIDREIASQHRMGKKQIVIPAGTYSIGNAILIDERFAGKEIVAEGEVQILSSLNGPVFHVLNTRNVKITGFTMRSIDPEDPTKPIAFYFQSPELAKNRSEGIRVTDSDHIQIVQNKISGYWSGIYITVSKKSCSDILVEKNRITDCGYWSLAAHYGAEGYDPQGKLAGIKFVGNYITRCEQGPIFRGVSDSAIEENEVVGNIIAVRLERSRSNIVRSNIIHHNLQMGIFLYSASDTMVTMNQIFDNNLQADRIARIARKHGMDPDYLPGDLVCFDRYSADELKPYSKKIKTREMIPELNTGFWPYPTAYEHITPGSRFGKATPEEFKKYWGMYFCQFSGVGILFQHRSNSNRIEKNVIYNSKPVKMETGYMPYAIRIAQLNLRDPAEYASRNNIILHNQIENMVKGNILDDNIRLKVEANNKY